MDPQPEHTNRVIKTLPTHFLPKVIHRIIDGASNGWLFKSVLDSPAPTYEDVHNIPTILIESGHTRLLDSIFASISNPKFTVDVVNAYLRRSDFQSVFDFIENHGLDNSHLSATDMLKNLMEANAPDSIVIRFAKWTQTAKEFGSRQFIQRSLLESLWKDERFSLGTAIIKKFIPAHEQKICTLSQRLRQGLPVTLLEIRNAMTDLFTPKSESTTYSWSLASTLNSRASHFIDELSQQIDDIIFIKDAYVIAAQAAQHENNPERTITLNYDLSRNILSALLTAEDYTGAEEFIAHGIARSHHQEEIALAKIHNGSQNGNRTLYEEGLRTYVALKDAELNQLLPDKDENSGLGKLEWFYRIKYYGLKAQKFAELALFELSFGHKDKAVSYIDAMIAATELSGKAPEECPEPHAITLKQRKRYIKKDLKRLFLVRGHFEALPARIGWNTKVKHPDILAAEKEHVQQQKEASAAPSENTRTNSLEAANQLHVDITKKMLEQGDVSDATEALLKNMFGFPGETEWQRACLILEAAPQQFSSLVANMVEEYFKPDESRWNHPTFDWNGLARFYAIAIGHGVLEKKDWDILYKGIRSTRFSHNGLTVIPHALVTSLVAELIAAGKSETAWDFYLTLSSIENGFLIGSEPLSSHTHEVCLAHFLSGTMENADNCPGIVAAMQGQYLSADAGALAQVEFWNTEVELHRLSAPQSELLPPEANHATDERTLSSEEARAQKVIEHAERELLARCATAPTVATFAKLLRAGTVRTTHEVKNALLAIHDSPVADMKMRMRTVDAMIELSIPGAEGMDEINRRDTPIEYVRYFFRKMVEKDLLHKDTLQYITSNDAHVPYLKQLIAEFPNEFNTVMETLNHYFNRNDDFAVLCNESNESATRLEPHEWEEVLRTLRAIGLFTPTVYTEARAAKFDPTALKKIGKQVASLKEGLFSKRPIVNDLPPQLTAEIIYSAYKPANISLFQVLGQCERLQDHSHQLDHLEIPEEGYPLKLQNAALMTKRAGEAELSAPALAHAIQYSAKSREDNEIKKAQDEVKQLCNLGKFRGTDSVPLSEVLQFIVHDPFVADCMLALQKASSDNDQYYALRYFQEVLEIYLEDNSERIITQYLTDVAPFTNKMISGFAASLRSQKMQSLYARQCKLHLDPGQEDIALAAQAISTVLLQKVKSLREARLTVASDLRKFETVQGQLLDTGLPELRAVISKNIAAFFGKASAGICTDGDVDLFERPDHFDINIIDINKKLCVGNVQGYIMEYEGEDHLLLRGFNPSVNLLKVITAATFCDAVLEVADTFARKNELAGIILCEQGLFLALSNRTPDITDYLIGKYHSNWITFPPFRIATAALAIVQGGYLVSSFKKNTTHSDLTRNINQARTEVVPHTEINSSRSSSFA